MGPEDFSADERQRNQHIKGMSPKLIAMDRELRLHKAITMRMAGADNYQIAKELGVTDSAVSHMISRELKRKRDEINETAEEMRQIDSMRLEAIIRRSWLKAFPSDMTAPLDYDAGRQIMNAIEKRSKILGYAAASKHQVDISHLQSQMGLVLEVVARAVPDEAMPKVYAALEEAIGTLQRKEAALEYSGT